MASQPANAEIRTHRRIRTLRNPERHDTIKNVTHKLRGLVFSVPAEQDLTEVKSRDTAVTDLSPFMGQGAAGATRGVPVVIGAKATKDVSVVETLSNIDFPVEIGHDKFYQETEDTAGDQDLFQSLRDA